MPAFKCT